MKTIEQQAVLYALNVGSPSAIDNVHKVIEAKRLAFLAGYEAATEWKKIDRKDYPQNHEKLSHSREYMLELYEMQKAEIEILKSKLEKLKQLILLVDPVVSNVIVNDVAINQWAEYIKCFPNEDEVKKGASE
jgi:hypothetical protein